MPTLIQTNQRLLVSEVVIKQICRIRNCNSTALKIISRPVQQQLIAFDCGVYTVVYTTDLANNIDPTDSSYEIQNIQHHPSRCLESRLLKSLPTTDKRTTRGKGTPCNLKLSCSCRKPFFVSVPDKDKGRFTVSC